MSRTISAVPTPTADPFAMSFALAFPALDPVAIEIGPIAVRWYALAYVAGLVLGWRYVRLLATRFSSGLAPRQVDDLLVWMALGVVLGGRLGHVLFYKPEFYAENPLHILYIWHGGMSFHGGLLGSALAIYLFARRHGLSPLAVGDLVACAAPIGLFFGRIANFINGELFGRVTEVSWGVVFPGGGPLPRHPSQLYEAALEGLVLFALMLVLAFAARADRTPGALTGAFLAGYGLARIVAELFREPDAYLGFVVGGATMGQVLSLPVALGGLALIAWARRKRAP